MLRRTGLRIGMISRRDWEKKVVRRIAYVYIGVSGQVFQGGMAF